MKDKKDNSSSSLSVNEHFPTAGDVTQLNSIMHTAPRVLEKRIGFESGRLSQGWYVLELVDKVKKNEFVYGGNTACSGGFNPDETVEFNDELYRVHSQDIMREKFFEKHGNEQIADEEFDKFLLNQLNLLNDRNSYKRIVKVLPIIRHDNSKPSDVQYPDAAKGNGIKQWTLTKQKKFLVVAKIPPGYIYGGGGACNLYK